MQLRRYQDDIYTEVNDAWAAGYRNVMAVLPTGAGKTVLGAKFIFDHDGASCFIAHRQELVIQISMALARFGIKHRIVGPKNVIRYIIQSHILELGRDYYDPAARCAVAGVDTIVRRETELSRWLQQVTLWIQDENHHQLANNKWGKAASMFPNARGLGITATPERTDGKGLGRHADGLTDIIIEGPGMRELITAGYLTDYRIFCPPSDLDLTTVTTGADGDYIRGQLALKTRASTIMGHVTESYLKIAPGKLGVTFAPDVEMATEFARMFNVAGVPAEVVSAKTPDNVRQEILRRFKNRQILQLVNCDLFGEGFDLPAIEVVTMARATQSYGLYAQQFGRALRPMDGKDRAIIIDHVGNVLRHGLPDRPRVWTLDRREKRSAEGPTDVIPMRVCCNPVCLAPYERVLSQCPFCGWIPTPASRASVEVVDGDLHELDPSVLQAMRGAVAAIDRDPSDVKHGMERSGASAVVCASVAARHRERQEAQSALREQIAIWAGWQRSQGRADSESYRRFYFQFGTDVITAQALGRQEADLLASQVIQVLEKGGVRV
jgi:superfamily II DNA or RNA helicase